MTALPPSPDVSLVMLSPACLSALLDSDLARAGAEVGLVLPAFFLDEAWLWRIRRDQMAGDRGTVGWLVHAVTTQESVVVGHAGFHGPPDAEGLVEVAYTIVPEQRGRGYAAAALRALLTRAAGEESVHRVRAAISPDNHASLHIVRAAGFAHVGEQWDDEDGLELVFERPA
jgi:[ribosomal protein S5]-alanine N-acetyltransferase